MNHLIRCTRDLLFVRTFYRYSGVNYISTTRCILGPTSTVSQARNNIVRTMSLSSRTERPARSCSISRSRWLIPPSPLRRNHYSNTISSCITNPVHIGILGRFSTTDIKQSTSYRSTLLQRILEGRIRRYILSKSPQRPGYLSITTYVAEATLMSAHLWLWQLYVRWSRI